MKRLLTVLMVLEVFLGGAGESWSDDFQNVVFSSEIYGGVITQWMT